MVQARRLAAPGWWRHRPFLPVPSGQYMAFRSMTQYGDPQHPPVPRDVVNYLRWARNYGGRRWGAGAQPPGMRGHERSS